MSISRAKGLNLLSQADNLALSYGQDSLRKQLRVEPTTAVPLGRKLALAV